MRCQHFLGRIKWRRSNQKHSKVCGYRELILHNMQLHLLGMLRKLLPCRGAGQECSPISKVRHRLARVLNDYRASVHCMSAKVGKVHGFCSCYCGCRAGTEPASIDTPSSKGSPGQQRTGRPMELGSKKFDIPTVCPLLVLLLTVAFKPLGPLGCATLTLRHALSFTAAESPSWHTPYCRGMPSLSCVKPGTTCGYDSWLMTSTQVEPYIAYGLLLLNLAVYGAGVALALTQGNDFSNDWFLSLAKMNDKVASGELYR